MATMNKSKNAIIEDANNVTGDKFTNRAKNIIANNVNSVKKNVINSDLMKFMPFLLSNKEISLQTS